MFVPVTDTGVVSSVLLSQRLTVLSQLMHKEERRRGEGGREGERERGREGVAWI